MNCRKYRACLVGVLTIALIALEFLVAALQGIFFVVGNVILPRMQGDSLNMDPTVVLLSLAVWGALWGVPGMFLSTPLTVPQWSSSRSSKARAGSRSCSLRMAILRGFLIPRPRRRPRSERNEPPP